MCHICADYDSTMVVSCMYYSGKSAGVSPALAIDSQYLNKISLLITGNRVIQTYHILKELLDLSTFCFQACLAICKQVL
jgi:hypothetical protein